MSRTLRQRSRDAYFKGRFRDWVNGTPGSWFEVTRTRTSTCTDFTGSPVVDSSLTSTQLKGCMIVNGRFLSNYAPSSLRYTEFEDWPIVVSKGTVSNVPLPAPSGWALDLVARTNPSRPVVTPLTLLQDLIELPRMLRDLPTLISRKRGILTAKGASNAYLSTIFGWMPFVEDIKKLLDLSSDIDKRAMELNRLYSSGGLRRKITLGGDHQVGRVEETLSGQGSAVIYIPVSVSVERTMWATIRWKPTQLVPHHPGDAKVRQLARQVVSGMTSEGLAKGLWDVLPWTWMVNWFTNVGNYALAQSNTVPAQHMSKNFMSQVKVTWTPGPSRPVNVLSDQTSIHCDQTYVQKTRIPSSGVTPGFQLPFIDSKRLSVLSALAIQRLK